MLKKPDIKDYQLGGTEGIDKESYYDDLKKYNQMEYQTLKNRTSNTD